MSYEVILSDSFKKEAKRLSKKYPSLKSDLSKLGDELLENPFHGIPLGNDVYKIRLAISSKGKGKSGGARVISFVKIIQTQVILLTIYNKRDRETISDKEIKEILKAYL